MPTVVGRASNLARMVRLFSQSVTVNTPVQGAHPDATSVGLRNTNNYIGLRPSSMETTVHLSAGYCVQSKSKNTMHLNVHSLMLGVLVESSKPDVVCNFETWLSR